MSFGGILYVLHLHYNVFNDQFHHDENDKTVGFFYIAFITSF